ncbi:multidrug transporter MatE [Clostridium novyi B str. ATCC 27606]|uniref:Multidrug transporter MatE n=2 Tax=Clostridium TaxID=1485 RepID=A0AA40IU23_CLONO|nr:MULTISPECIES: MATE family efflux transporter [Clostridium]KEI13918.1 multidrug transporter MatE [Clostridium novyi B str. NCTC 9691]KEI16092.1 multidrug transporter MatE [Clostridium haemolyticum NCTC 9693]KEI16267.1 multidrug transporter MatE [Clostridium novyi B str. ATCC 27606]CAG7840503.1 putative FMN/FAD exporter YeeO [Clostridium haemolyticum]
MWFKEDIIKDKAFYKKLFFITLPIVIQNLIASSLNMLDTLMIGKVGEVELASVGIANQYYFLYSLLILGISEGCGVFIAQLWGKKDKQNIKKILGMGLKAGIIMGIIFMIMGAFIPTKIISLFNTDPRVIKTGSEYLSIVIFSYIFTSITFNYAAALRGIQNTVVPMIASFVGLITNGILNYIFIFGKLGFPAMGVKGAAIATVIARMVESLIIIIFVYSKNKILNARLSELTNVPKAMLSLVYKITLPIVMNEACWALGNVTYAAIYGRIGTGAAASIQICTTIMNVFMIITFGLANASVVVIGNEIGASREEQGRIYAKRISRLTFIISIILSIILAIVARPILSLFNISDAVRLDSLYILYIYSLVLVVKVCNNVLIVGILRGGGDATYGSILQAITLWFIGIPLAAFAAFVLKLPVYLVVFMTSVEEITKVVMLLKRFYSNRWIHNMVQDM